MPICPTCGRHNPLPEEDWFFQALIERYLPLMETLERASAVQQPKLTIGLSPTLLSLLAIRTSSELSPVAERTAGSAAEG